MKLLVFAHTPPPLHGQSLMVQLMVEGFGGDHVAGATAAPPAHDAAVNPAANAGFGIECYHVNARLASGLDDVGRARAGKLWPLLKYCLEAIRLRLRHGITTFYYVPSPAQRTPLYRDWIVMALCRPWFRRMIFHWHAVGLGTWLAEAAAGWERRLSHWLLDRADLALVLSEFNQGDAARFHPRTWAVVPNGIVDPCPEYARTMAPIRTARTAERRARLTAASAAVAETGRGGDPRTVGVLFLAHCTREKGLFDAIDGIRLANQRLAQGHSGLRMKLTVAGAFLTEGERAEFDRVAATPEAAGWLAYAGFVTGDPKADLFRQADLFCFPTYYANEGQPVALLEAMAYGLPLLTSRWRAIPELVPTQGARLVEPRQPEQVAAGLLELLAEDGAASRARFLERYTVDRYLAALAAAIRR